MAQINQDKKINILIIFLIISILLLTVTTKFYGISDFGDYGGVAKFFAGDYAAKLRTSHSISYGLIHAPFVALTNNFFLLKMVNLGWLLLIALSLYHISNNDKRTLLLFLVSPVVWYMAPSIGPIQLASLLFLWGYYFFQKYESSDKTSYFIYAGLLMGLSAVFWNSAIFIIGIFAFCFFLNKSVKNTLLFSFVLLIGYLPNLLVSKFYYNSWLYITLKFILATFSFVNKDHLTGDTSFFLPSLILCLFFFPLFIYQMLKKKYFIGHKKSTLFLILGYLFILLNPQPRYILFLWPILLLLLIPTYSKNQLKWQVYFFIIISLIVSLPYVIQIFYKINTPEINSVVAQNFNILISNNLQNGYAQDLLSLSKDYPNESFIVGNSDEKYELLALAYWGKEITEFVSIQDYRLWEENSTNIWNKKITLSPMISERREIWISGGVNKNSNDFTNYSEIKYGLGVNEPLKLKGFKFVKRYGPLYLSIKEQPK